MEVKQCPYCNLEMKNGYLYNYTNPNQWIPIDRKPPILRGSVTKGGVRTGNGNWFYGFDAKSFYCEKCKIILTPVDSEK